MKRLRIADCGLRILSPERRVSGATTHGHTVAQAATPVLGPRAFVRRLGQFLERLVPFLCSTLLRVRTPALRGIALANEDAPGGEAEEVVGLENEFSLGSDGWLKIAPYGRSVKERMARGRDGRAEHQTFEQVLDKPAAEEMCRKFNSLWGRVKRFVVGVPIYRNHPDLTKRSPETIVPTVGLANSASPCGMFAALEAREDGFYGRPIVSEEGRQAIERDGLKWISPFWFCNTVGEKNGIKIVKPFELISAGLVRFPNIPGGEALANSRTLTTDGTDNADNENKIMNKDKLVAALAKLGIVALANDADEKIIAAIEAVGPKLAGVTALENEKSTLTTAKATVETALTTEKTARTAAESKVTELTTALANERTALANERKARIDMVVDGALISGKITAAERAGWITRLETGFEAGVTALANEAVKVKVTSITRDAGDRKGEGATQTEASRKVTALANERMTKTGADWKTAWLEIKEENPALFEAMK